MTDQKTEITTSSTNLEETKTDSTNKEEQVKDEEEESVTFIGIKRKRPKNIRKKSEDDQKSPENEQSKNNETNESKDDTKETHTMKKPKIQKGILTSTTKGKIQKEESVTFAYQSSKTAVPAGHPDQRATATLEIDPEKKSDDQPQIENADGIYRGMSGYRSYLKKGQTAVPGKAGGLQVGPIRAPSNVRITARFDYQPDICKDYKETGYCGFGDSCKFLHDRGDYKTGWQLEREWEEEQRKKKERALQRFQSLNTGTSTEDSHDDDEKGEYYVGDSDDEELPFACFICRQHFKNPVVTLCGHYFCEDCALNHYRKDSRCFICKEQTKGIFNTAHKIIRKQKKIEEMKAKRGESNKKDDNNLDTSIIIESEEKDDSKSVTS